MLQAGVTVYLYNHLGSGRGCSPSDNAAGIGGCHSHTETPYKEPEKQQGIKIDNGELATIGAVSTAICGAAGYQLCPGKGVPGCVGTAICFVFSGNTLYHGVTGDNFLSEQPENAGMNRTSADLIVNTADFTQSVLVPFKGGATILLKSKSPIQGEGLMKLLETQTNLVFFNEASNAQR